MPPGHGWWGQLQPAAALDAERDQVRTEAARLLEVDPAEIVLVEHPRAQGVDIRAHWIPAAKSPGGPYVVNQVFTVATGWGYAARCGCGWKTAHETKIAALIAGQRHLRAEHGLEHAPAPLVGAEPERGPGRGISRGSRRKCG